jgi:hypothetical protein
MSSIPRIGSYVTHAKLPELGSGEVLHCEGDKVAIRFASGERSFIYDLALKHLTVTLEGPAPKPTKAPRAPRAKKAATEKAPKASKAAAVADD